MKVVKVIVIDDENKEQELNIVDGFILAVCDDNKILTQSTQNAAINFEAIKKLLK